MSSNQIQIRWNDARLEDYEASLVALRKFSPVPAIKASISIKGEISEDILKRIVGMSDEYVLDVTVMLTATWQEDESPQQLRLFSQSFVDDTDRDVEWALPSDPPNPTDSQDD